MRSGDLAGQSYGAKRPAQHYTRKWGILLLVGRREVTHHRVDTKSLTLSVEECLAEEDVQEIQTIFRGQTVLNDRCCSKAFPNDNAQDIHRTLVMKLSFCSNVWLAVGPVFMWTAIIVVANIIYLLNAIGLTPGGSSTVHTDTQTIHRTTQLITRTTHRGKVWRAVK